LTTFALITPGGSTLGPWELDDDEAEPGPSFAGQVSLTVA
jgi:hypothetical protein